MPLAPGAKVENKSVVRIGDARDTQPKI